MLNWLLITDHDSWVHDKSENLHTRTNTIYIFSTSWDYQLGTQTILLHYQGKKELDHVLYFLAYIILPI